MKLASYLDVLEKKMEVFHFFKIRCLERLSKELLMMPGLEHIQETIQKKHQKKKICSLVVF